MQSINQSRIPPEHWRAKKLRQRENQTLVSAHN